MKCMQQNRNILVLSFLICLSTMTVTAQNNPPLLGHWQLQKISFKNKAALVTVKDKERFVDIFKAALYKGLTEEQRLNLDDLEVMNAEAEILRDTYFQTTIEFQPNGAYYNTSLHKDKSLSGEYLLDRKKLLLEWETADKTNFKILKNTTDELVLKDTDLKIIYSYIQLDKKKVDEFSARLKKAKDLECTKPDKVRIEAEKAAIKKMKTKID